MVRLFVIQLSVLYFSLPAGFDGGGACCFLWPSLMTLPALCIDGPGHSSALPSNKR